MLQQYNNTQIPDDIGKDTGILIDNEDTIDTVFICQLPKPKREQSVYYVTEKDLWNNTLELYRTGEFPKALADDILKMTKRILTSHRWDGCGDLLKEEMLSRAYNHVCQKLIERKFNFKHGSKVYSWVTRVIINECLQAVLQDKKRREQERVVQEQWYIDGNVEIMPLPNN